MPSSLNAVSRFALPQVETKLKKDISYYKTVFRKMPKATGINRKRIFGVGIECLIQDLAVLTDHLQFIKYEVEKLSGKK